MWAENGKIYEETDKMEEVDSSQYKNDTIKCYWKVIYMLVMLIIAALVVFFAIALVRTVLFTSKQIPVEPAIEIPVVEKAAEHLARAIQFKTVSYQETERFDKKEFLGLHDYLKETYPEVHSTLTREIVNEYSLLYTWNGKDLTLKPIVLMAHMDVVPTEPGTENDWLHPPFEGAIADKYIWGRGSMDIKSGILGILEAVEMLMKEGFKPDRTIYLAFGHDEEVGGRQGASKIASLLKSRGISAEYVLDEGGSVTEGIVPGVSVPVALVGIAEKGYVSLELTVESEGGHSSMPPKKTAIGVMAAAIQRLEDNQMRGAVKGTVKLMFEYLGPEMSITRRIVFSNLWLFGWLVERKLAALPEMNAAIRTTTAPVMVEGGTKENILPKKARAVINFRILPGDTVNKVVEHAQKTIDDSQVKITVVENPWDPSVVSSLESESFITVQKTIRQIFPKTVVAPYLVAGATDSRYYGTFTENVFKFAPLYVSKEDLKRIHGVNERISVGDYETCVRFYVQLIRNSACNLLHV